MTNPCNDLTAISNTYQNRRKIPVPIATLQHNSHFLLSKFLSWELEIFEVLRKRYGTKVTYTAQARSYEESTWTWTECSELWHWFTTWEVGRSTDEHSNSTRYLYLLEKAFASLCSALDDRPVLLCSRLGFLTLCSIQYPFHNHKKISSKDQGSAFIFS